MAEVPAPSLSAPPGYMAVPGRILSIPGTEYVLITPDWSSISTGQCHEPRVALPAKDINSSVVKLCHPEVKDQHDVTLVPQTTPTPSEVNVDVSLEGNSSAFEQNSSANPLPNRSRGRPPKNRSMSPCQCPNCQIKPNSDRHLCHFTNCGKTFTKRHHLEAHIRKHVGLRPFVCPQQNCNASFSRYEELKRHYWVHCDEPRFRCQWCDKKFNRIDHYKCHMRYCTSASAGGLVNVLSRMEKEDEAREAQENQAALDITPQGDKEEKEEVIDPKTEETQPKTMKEETEASKKSDPIIISDEDSDVEII